MDNNSNPKLALDAMLESPQLVGELKVQPMTVARMALLELVGSPFIDGSKKFTMANMTESAFIMCAETAELKGFSSRNIDALIDKAYQWADKIDVKVMPKVIETVLERLNSIYKVNPATGSADGEDPKN